jgi:hypothetical protein
MFAGLVGFGLLHGLVLLPVLLSARARPRGGLAPLAVSGSHHELVLCSGSVRARRALNSPKWCFPARAAAPGLLHAAHAVAAAAASGGRAARVSRRGAAACGGSGVLRSARLKPGGKASGVCDSIERRLIHSH